MINSRFFVDSRAPSLGAPALCGPASWIGSAIGAGTNLLGGLLGFGGQSKSNKTN